MSPSRTRKSHGDSHSLRPTIISQEPNSYLALSVSSHPPRWSEVVGPAIFLIAPSASPYRKSTSKCTLQTRFCACISSDVLNPSIGLIGRRTIGAARKALQDKVHRGGIESTLKSTHFIQVRRSSARTRPNQDPYSNTP